MKISQILAKFVKTHNGLYVRCVYVTHTHIHTYVCFENGRHSRAFAEVTRVHQYAFNVCELSVVRMCAAL